MISLRPSDDPELALKFCEGVGLRSLCSRGSNRPLSPEDAIAIPDNHFLFAYDDGKPVGFIVFSKLANQRFSVHLVLRTIGGKTREAFCEALRYARSNLDAVAVYAYYPKSRASCERLANEFGFEDDEVLAACITIPEQTEEFAYKSLTFK